MFKKKNPLIFILKKTTYLTAIVLIWRGIWILLDEIDILLFNGSQEWTAIGGIILGLILLVLPEKNLKNFEKI